MGRQRKSVHVHGNFDLLLKESFKDPIVEVKTEYFRHCFILYLERERDTYTHTHMRTHTLRVWPITEYLHIHQYFSWQYFLR